MQKKPLTKKQRQTFDYLITFRDRNGYMPSLAELAKHFDIAIVSVHERLRHLQNKGWVWRAFNDKRGIVITGHSPEHPIRRKGCNKSCKCV